MSELEYANIFSKRLKYYMELNNKKQSDIVHDLNINKSAISTWINGTRMPRMDKVQILADYFGVKKSDLLEDKKENESYYINNDAKEYAQFLFENPDYRVLFSAVRKVSKEDLDTVRQIIDKFKGDVDE